MTYCFHCGKYTAGDPLFCNRCGRSYDVRLCPRLHPNPRHAHVCSQCGSAELSTPQPMVPLWRKALALAVHLLLTALLILASLLVSLVLVIELLETREVQEGLVIIGFLLIGCWLLWTRLPDWLRKMVRKAVRGKESHDAR